MSQQYPEEFFLSELQKSEQQLQRVKQKLLQWSLLRLILFLIAVIPFFIAPVSIQIAFVVCAVFMGLFLWAVSRHTDLQLSKQQQVARIKICEDELKGLKGDYSSFKNGSEYASSNHAFTHDLDVFGERYFFQSLNRTSLKESEQMLADHIRSNNIENVIANQELVQELCSNPLWCLDFRTSATIVGEFQKQEMLLKAMKSYTPVIPKFFKLIVPIFISISVILFGLSLLDIIHWNILMVMYFAGVAITGYYLKASSKLNLLSGNLSREFIQLGVLLDLIESKHWQSEKLGEFESEKQAQSSSEILREFGQLISLSDQKNNVFFMVFVNPFILMNVNVSLKLENWIQNHHQRLENIFRRVNTFDCGVSLANYAFTHPSFVYPEIGVLGKEIVAIDLAHPMIDVKKSVKNSFDLNNKEFFLITGANMAGKSTFLRSVGMAIMMANAGLPVCASQFTYRPIKLISTMRSSDSLISDESYFFSELKRLKYIVETVAKESYLILMDEILKGTNSKDKEEGSRKLILKLLRSDSCGLIATHDLSLCDIESRKENLKNYYFEAEIINDELSFDYKLKRGVCQNMNASFLLKKMKIVDE